MKTINKIGLSMAALALSACAGISTQKNKTPEEIVVERAQARYDALMQKDEDGLAKAYTYTSPSFRTYTTVKQYNAKVAGRGMWNKVSVRKAECEESICKVMVDLTYTSPQLKIPLTRPFYEKWIEINDQWWIYHK